MRHNESKNINDYEEKIGDRKNDPRHIIKFIPIQWGLCPVNLAIDVVQ